MLHLADLVLVMSVNPGFSNQAFLPDAVSRVAKVRKMLDELKSTGVSGGGWRRHAENIARLKNAGANVFVTAHAIFSHPQGIAAGIRRCAAAIKQPGSRRGPDRGAEPRRAIPTKKSRRLRAVIFMS